MRIRLIATIAFFSLIYTFFYSILPESLLVVYKLFPMILIILLASSINTKNFPYKRNIIIALIFCTFADLTFQWFIVSLTSFFIGFLFYLRAFLTVKNDEAPLYIKWMLTILGIAIIYWIGGSVYNQYSFLLTIVICVYIIVILMMGCAAFKTISQLAIAGALLLMFSNFIAAINKLITPIDYSHQLIMITYYTAHLLLALSIADYSENKIKSDTMKQT